VCGSHLVRSDTSTAEERVQQIRAALDNGDRSTAEHHFATLLQDSKASTERWLRRTIALTPALHNASAYPVCEELRQELAFYLWQHVADPTRHEMAWEHTYWRALLYAQKHVAFSYMCQAGFWVSRRTTKQATRGVAEPLDGCLMDAVDEHDALLAADLADVRTLVMQLPPKERAAVVLRYWQDMREQDIAHALGCTERNVRILLHQAHQRLGIWYEGSVDVVAAAQGGASAPMTLQTVGARELE
jgi:RNA polymerase sigma factor (sigma-70 family)